MEELFNTNGMFTLSGNQAVKVREFKKPEKRAPLTYWVTVEGEAKTVTESIRVTTDQLYERKAFTKGRK